MDIIGLENKSNSEIRKLLENGGKVVYFEYTISLIFITQNKNSPFFYVPADESATSFGWKYFFLSLFFGWWGFPWGPIYTIGTLFSSLFGGKDVTKEVLSSLPADFKMKISDGKLEIDDFNLDTFDVNMKGSVNGYRDDFNAKIIVNIFDITNGKEEVVLSTLERFQKDNSEVFWYESSEVFPYANTLISDWSLIVKIPKEFLVFPNKGKRRLKFKMYIIDSNSDHILVESTKELSYNCLENGYQDDVENREYFEEVIIKTALLVSYSDGIMDKEETKTIEHWMRKRISNYNEEYQEKHRVRLNGYMKDGLEEIKNEYVDIYDVLEGIENIASEGDKYELFQLCLDVARADGEADKKELDILDDIAEYIHLDEKQFRSMIEKTLPINIHTGEQTPEQILGISSKMSNSEIQKHLRVAFKKWNAVVAHKDAQKREQAEEMLKIITELRSKYK